MISECSAPAQILESPPVATSVSADAKGGRWCCKAFCFLPPGALQKMPKNAQKMPKFPPKIKVFKKDIATSWTLTWTLGNANRFDEVQHFARPGNCDVGISVSLWQSMDI